MEEYLRFGLLVLATIILIGILTESWWRQRRFKKAEMNLIESEREAIQPMEMDVEPTYTPRVNLTARSPEYLSLSVFATQGNFASYDLLQAISATGMTYGEMNIFHYHVGTESRKIPLFSLASATKPGYFDLDKIGEFACAGLTLFMDLRNSTNPAMAFNQMLKTAEQLADDLEGELRQDPFTPWTSASLTEYRKRIQQFQHENTTADY